MSIKFDDNNQPFIDLGQNYKIYLDFKKVVYEKYLAKAKEELRETPEIREQALNELRELIKNEKNLVFPTDDFFLETYLRPCKFYAKSAFEKIQVDSKFKIKYKKFYENIDIEATRAIFEGDLFKYMPLRDKEGRRIILIRTSDKWKLTRNNHKELFNALQIFFQMISVEPLTQVNGVCIILDMKKIDYSQVTALTPSLAMMLVKFAQECMPIRFKRVFIVNNPRMFSVFWALLAPFISKKYKDRTHIVGNKYEILVEHMGKDCLGKEYGGNVPVENVDGKVFTDFLKLYEKQFELMSLSGYIDENENIDERRKKVDACAKEILTFINV